MRISATERDAYRRDGVIHLARALDTPTLDAALAAWNWSLEHPGPGAARLPANGDGTFYQDLANPAALRQYCSLVQDTVLADLVTDLFGQPDVHFMYEQVFLKDNGTTRRTPWHQDTPYLPVTGDDLAVLWITFEPVAAANALEFVRASHRGVLYDGSRFDPADDTAPLYGTGAMPRLPDIEADRSAFDIVSWDIEPGDVLVFHPSILHGGGPTTPGMRRRTLSLRYFGADARVAGRPGMKAVEHEAATNAIVRPDEHPLTRMRRRRPGDAFSDPGFVPVRAGDTVRAR
ncbi:MAG: phytanoyl-CoA dioxygenase family protein [Gammaproteobacteria bacterium]